MTPVKQITKTVEANITFAVGQPQYRELPVYMDEYGYATSRWKLGLLERLRILIFGDLWLTVATFGHPLQPVRLDTDSPFAKEGR